MAVKTISKASSSPQASPSALQKGGESVSGVRAMRHLVNSDGTKGGDVIFDGHNFGPATHALRNLIQIHRAARRREEEAYAGEDDDLTDYQLAEREQAHRAAMMAALDIVCDGDRPKADDVAVMLYASEAGVDFEALQSLSYSDLRVFRDAYSAHGLKLAKCSSNDGATRNLAELIDYHRIARQAVEDFDVDTTPEPEQERIMAVESDAFDTVLSFRCNTIGEIQYKADYLVNGLDNGNRLFQGELDSPRTFMSQFMRSMLPLDEVGKGSGRAFDLLEAAGVQAAEAYALSSKYENCATEARNQKDKTSEIYFENAQQEAYDRYAALRDMFASCEAQSTLGAMLQLAEAFSALDLMCSQIEEHVPGSQKRAIERLIVSPLRFLERENGANLVQLGFGCMRNANCDPWEPVEKRLSDISKASRAPAST